jgi:hypothetical protein
VKAGILAFLAAALVAAASVGADGALTVCKGKGVTSGGLTAAVCETDLTAGRGVPHFSKDFLTATLSAHMRKKGYETAWGWSEGPLVNTQVAGGPITVCATFTISGFDASGDAHVTNTLIMSWDGSEHPGSPFAITEDGTTKLCGSAPPGAGNVFFQLLTDVTGTGPRAHAKLTEQLDSAP